MYCEWQKETVVIFKQPEEEKGEYTKRSCSRTPWELKDKCITLDDVDFGGGEKCLKWGSSCYFGRMTIPEGVKVTTYKGWDCSGSGRVFNYEKDKSTDFWDYWSRKCFFQVEIAPSYKCGCNWQYVPRKKKKKNCSKKKKKQPCTRKKRKNQP
mmetsp:Transcript_105272/g.209246  ORF Transcript_105272/g.209246 Transcript_105272/m.209246 type:complete len:153 (+) Transcript_105272:480-938(+)